MATATETTKRPSDLGGTERTEQRFVDEQIRRTRRALKSVDLVAGCITLVIGILSYLLTMAILEHWVVPGGLSPTARAMLLILLVGGVLWYGWRYFWPLLSQPINPVYAAHTIEQGSPTLKNSLLNLLLLRNRRRQISRQVYEAIESQAAHRLSQSPVDSAVDRSSILRLGYVLVAVVALCTLYRILSPKDPLASAGRLLMPWANIAVPSRVQILDVQPGDTSAARGEQLAISAEILGKSQDEPVRLVYSQVDGQISDQEILMTGDEAGLRYSAKVPGRIAMGSSGGLQGDLVYHIEAGDARSPDFRVSVFSQPTLVVERIRYEYPLYTGYPPREEAFVGDISGLEGTVVTLYAVANQPIEQAHVDFEADGRHDLLMNSEKLSSSVRFPLEFKEDRRTQQHQSYVLRYTTTEGRKNPSPPKYRIHVQRDLSPEVELIQPVEELLDVRLDEEVLIEVEARDPDFALYNVAVLGEVGGERVMKESLLSTDHTGRFASSLKIVPAKLGLQEGDILEYWAAAADNRRPEPNLAFSSHKKLRIVGPNQRDRLPDNEQENQSGEGPGENGDQGEGGEQGEGQEGEGQQGQPGGGENQQGGEGQQQGEGGPGQQSGESGEGEQQGQQGQAGEQEQSGEGTSQGEAGGQSQGEGAAEGQEKSDAGSDNSQGEPSAESDRVSPDGDNDGEAFDRIAKHLEEQQQQGENAEGSTAENSAGQEQTGEGQQSEGEQSEGAGSENQGKEDGQQQGEGAEEQSDSEGTGGNDQDQPPSEDEGGQVDPADQNSQDGSQEGEQGGQQQGDSSDAEMSQEQGDAGAGDNPGENEGTPNHDVAQKPSEKETDAGNEPPTNDQEAPAESQSKKESDAEGSQGGDRSGGGQEGAGQQADEQGKGAAGENQSAEDGAGQSSETGEGETGEQAGGEQTAEGKTGESSGDQAGEGSEQGEQKGTKPGESESESPAKPGEESGDPSETSGGTPEAGGTGSNNSPPPSGGELEPADEANLEYARKQTDLVLNTLEEQLRNKKVDKELLEKLGWTADELQKFVNRWKDLKEKANAGGPNANQARDEFNTALRTLGIDPNRRRGFKSRNAKDELRDLNESVRVRTPLEYQELMRKYNKGIAGADGDE